MGVKQLLAGACVLLGIMTSQHAMSAVVASGNGFEVSYGINMTPGSPNTNSIGNVVILETDGTNFSLDYGYSIAATGVTTLTHTVGFAPTASLIVGTGYGSPGVGDGKDHIFMVLNSQFMSSIIGGTWGLAFPGDGNSRLRHSEFVSLLALVAQGDTAAIETLTDFANLDAQAAWFDTNGAFLVAEFTGVGPHVGSNVPEPGTLALLGIGLAGFSCVRRKR